MPEREHAAAVRYTDRGTSAEHCSVCKYYAGGIGPSGDYRGGPNECEIVIERIRPSGWCERFKEPNYGRDG